MAMVAATTAVPTVHLPAQEHIPFQPATCRR